MAAFLLRRDSRMYTANNRFIRYIRRLLYYKSTTDDLTDNYFAMSSWCYDGGNKKAFQNPRSHKFVA